MLDSCMNERNKKCSQKSKIQKLKEIRIKKQKENEIKKSKERYRVKERFRWTECEETVSGERKKTEGEKGTYN